MSNCRFCVAIVLLIIALLCIPLTSHSAESDEGYFLSLKQKGQVIWYGEISDNSGNLYDILDFICPGYVQPTRYSWKGFGKAADHMAEYVHAEKYRRAKDNMHEILVEITYDVFLKGVTIRDTKRAWSRNFSRADETFKKRAFGWWLAYPWALGRSTVHTAFQVSSGLTYTAVGTVIGLVGVPVYHTLNSSAAALYNGSIKGVTVPALGYTVNTIFSPPLALFGQKPALSRVDGFWVRLKK
jgi:hypothetical protein